MKILKGLLIIISLTAVTCNRDKSPVLPDDTAEYFPLQVGNNWVYKSSLDNAEWNYEITDTKIIGTNIYYELVRTFPDGTKDTNYFRRSEDNVIQIYYEGKDHLYIDFNKPLNEAWNTFGDYYGYIRQRDIRTDVDAGQFTNVTEVVFDSKSSSDLYEFNHYAAGAGVVRSMRFRFELTLKKALINGVSFP